MLAVVQMIQESEGRTEEEEEEEVRRRRREVGCQWESPEEDRKEVGCQSDSAERRDAAVQVDLLTQQLNWRHTGVCGVAWQCVSVRADEPGGGALLQHCSSTLDTGQHSPPPRQTLLPTMPLSRPPEAPQQLKELQQTALLPSMPLCEPLPPADVSAPPPGLIAPLSPHLAEEEEEEDEGLLKHENNESFHGNRQSTAEMKKKKRRRRAQRSESSTRSCNISDEKSQPIKLTSHRPCSKSMRDDDEKSQPERCQDVIQSGERSSVRKVRSKTQQGETRQRCTKKGRPEERIKRTRAQGGENRRTEEKKKKTEEEEEEEGGQKRRCTEDQRKDDFIAKEEEETRRLRRKTVGPPIRYLLESEEWSHGLSAANHKAMGVKVKRKLGREHQQENEAEEEEEEQKEEKEDGVKPVKTEVTGRQRRKMVGPPIRYLLESEEWSHGLSAANHSKERGVKEEERRGGVEITERTDSSRVKSTENRRVDRGCQFCQVCGQAFTCPLSLQLHLSVHRGGRRLRYHLCNSKFSRVNAPHLHRRRHHYGNPGRCHVNKVTTMTGGTQAADDKQDKGVNTNSDGEMKEGEERSNEEEVKTLLPASTKAPDWLRRINRVRRNPRWWVDYRITKMRRTQNAERWGRRQDRDGGMWKKKGREEKEVIKEVVEQPQRPRRKMVGPPIRYLLESEEPSHGLVTANQNRAKGFKQGGKPQKMNKVMIDRPEDTEQSDMQSGWTVTERQTGHMITERQTSHMVRERQSGETNQGKVNRPKRRGGTPIKFVMDSDCWSGDSEMTDRSEAAERQTGQVVSDRQTGLDRQICLVHKDMQSGQVTVMSPCCVRLQRLL